MQQRAIETRRRVVLAAAQVVETKGYEGASVSDILDVAGLTKGAMYHHFDSKSSLVRALIDEQFAPVLAPPKITHSPVLHVAEITMEATATLVTDVEFRAAFGVIIDRPHRELGDITRPINDWHSVFEALFQSALDSNTLLPEVDPRTESNLLIDHLIGQFCVSRTREDLTASFDPLVDYWRLLVSRAVKRSKRSEHLQAIEDLSATLFSSRHVKAGVS